MAAGHMGVIVQLAESCAESEEKQDELMQCLLHVSFSVFVIETQMSTWALNQYNNTLVSVYSCCFMTETKTPDQHYKTTYGLIYG